jgi:uncharacterized membrane protein YdjX (TVP38/TMEM64 family)
MTPQRNSPNSYDGSSSDHDFAVEVGDESNSNSNTAEEEPEEEVSEKKRTRNCYLKTAVAFLLILFVAFVIADSLTNGYVKDGITGFLEWIEANPVGGVFAFTIVVFVTTLLFVPGVILTLGAGFVFANTFGLGVGIVLGTLAVFVGGSAGAIVSFLLGRFLLRDCVTKLTKKFDFFKALDNAFDEKGFRIMILLRLSPLIYNSPYLNYGAGGTAISFWAFVLSLFAILPGTVLMVFLGASAGSLATESDSVVQTIVLVVGIVLSFFAVALVSYNAKKELATIIAANNRNDTAAEEIDDDDGNSLSSGSLSC